MTLPRLANLKSSCHGRELSPPAHAFFPPVPHGLGEARRKCGQILASTFLPGSINYNELPNHLIAYFDAVHDRP